VKMPVPTMFATTMHVAVRSEIVLAPSVEERPRMKPKSSTDCTDAHGLFSKAAKIGSAIDRENNGGLGLCATVLRLDRNPA
jgi:hypothetical protein